MQSTTLTIRISPALKAKLQKAAKKDHRSVTSMVIHALAIAGIK